MWVPHESACAAYETPSIQNGDLANVCPVPPHPAGDEVLKGVAALASHSARKADTVACYGGEEFAMLLPDVDEQSALGVAQRVRAAIERHAFSRRKVTISAGVAFHAGGPTNSEALIKRADDALYRAKREGRNRVVAAE